VSGERSPIPSHPIPVVDFVVVRLSNDFDHVIAVTMYSMLATAPTGTCNVANVDYGSMCGSGLGFGGLGLDTFGFHHYRVDGVGSNDIANNRGSGSLLSMYGASAASSRLHHEFTTCASSSGSALSHRPHHIQQQPIDGRGCTGTAASSTMIHASSDSNAVGRQLHQLQEQRGNCSPPSSSSTSSYRRPHQFGADLQQQQQQQHRSENVATVVQQQAVGVRMHRNALVNGTSASATSVDSIDHVQYDTASTAATALRSHCYGARHQQHPAAMTGAIYYGSPCDPTAGVGHGSSGSSTIGTSVETVSCCDGTEQTSVLAGGSSVGLSTTAVFPYGGHHQTSSTIVPGHTMQRTVAANGNSCAFAGVASGYVSNGTSASLPPQLLMSSTSSCGRISVVGDSTSSSFDGSRTVGPGCGAVVEQLQCRLQQQQQQQQLQSASTGTYKWMTIKRNTPKTINQQSKSQCFWAIGSLVFSAGLLSCDTQECAICNDNQTPERFSSL